MAPPCIPILRMFPVLGPPVVEPGRALYLHLAILVIRDTFLLVQAEMQMGFWSLFNY